MALAFLCDFDGTAAPDDIGAEFVRRFGVGATDELERALERWRHGDIGHRELTRVECGRLAVTEPQALAFAKEFAVDPEFAGFVAAAMADGHRVAVASEGFDFYITDLLGRAGLGGLALSSNRLVFDSGRAIPEFPHPRGCGRCGNCKGARVTELRDEGYTVVMVGDGFSDRCGARAADHVVARGSLLDWCGAQGLEAEPFSGFTGLTAWMRSPGRAGRPAPDAPDTPVAGNTVNTGNTSNPHRNGGC